MARLRVGTLEYVIIRQVPDLERFLLTRNLDQVRSRTLKLAYPFLPCAYPLVLLMARQKLTKIGVEGMKPGPEELVVWDTALPGFGLRIKPTGVRSYIVQYRTRDTGQSKRMTIGQHGPLLTFDQAKKQARGILTDAARGRDPVAERRSKRQAPTMRDLRQTTWRSMPARKSGRRACGTTARCSTTSSCRSSRRKR